MGYLRKILKNDMELRKNYTLKERRLRLKIVLKMMNKVLKNNEQLF